ncbi:DUF350 domain-containing protein [Sulfuricurvum sp.]|uniref:DUF350 domain-containing protein n=1 Tax=Sulfuricurvum sp. TaxID=2025608 RepID=UPI002604AF09|nr:DUF350 domain-containing protein [Sulfuricurvum sp.]MDD3597446.1 DUF350 domain-containing protein [Sulfuricurvum sp.]
MEILLQLSQSGLFLLISVVMLLLSRSLFFIYEKWIDKEDTVLIADNIPEAIRRAGLFIGAAIALSAPLLNGSKGTFTNDLIITVSDAMAILFLMLVTVIVNDKIYIAHLDNGDAICGGNATVGFIESGAYIATGLVLYGSFVGSGPWLSSIVFFILTQSVLFLIMKLYAFQATFDLKQAIDENNLSAGILIAGMFIGYGILLSTAVRGDFTDWVHDMKDFFSTVAFAIVLIAIVFNSIIDKLFFPKINMREAIKNRNVPVAIITAAVKISLAVIVAQLIV